MQPFPDVDSGRWQVSTSGGSQPMWAPSGQELFYRSPAWDQTTSVLEKIGALLAEMGSKLATVTLRFTHSQDNDRPTEWHITHSTRRDKSKFQLNNGPERSMDILMDDIVSTFLRQTSVYRSNRMQ